jgi:uncharacterized protein (TIGR00252 family)
MTIQQIKEQCSQGRLEQAYAAIRELYATDKSPQTAETMFSVAVEILKKRVEQKRMDEARKILMALERMQTFVSLPLSEVWKTLHTCALLIEKRTALVNKKCEHLQTGRWGEDMAAAYLREKGFVIIERDWHSGHRDIDIVARHGEYVVFVEVKTRRSHSLTTPISAIDEKKRHHLLMAINHYVKTYHVDAPVRFDIIAVVGTADGMMPEITHIEDVRIL